MFLKADDDDDDGPLSGEICQMEKCRKMGIDFCDCGFWLCKVHFAGKNVRCTLHDINSSDSDTATVVKKSKLTKKTLFIKTKEVQRNTCGKKTIIQNLPCEFKNCKEEIFAACGQCLCVLCWEHFQNSDSCEFHKVDALSGKSLDKSVKTPIIRNPEDCVVDGAEKEAPIMKRKRINFSKINKTLKRTGKGYIKPKSMNLVPPKTLRPACTGDTCKNFGRLCRNFTEDQRNDILSAFYELGDLTRQREFVVRHIRVEKTKQKTTTTENSRRKNSNYYFLPLEGKNVPVCRSFFLATLSISQKVVRTALTKISNTGILEGEMRGGKSKKNQDLDKIKREDIENHIKRFPRVESHYCRSSSTREYLYSDLTIPKMYALYLNDCNHKPPGSITTYRRVFKSLNLSFHSPKKDQCSLCMMYKQGDTETKLKLEEMFSKHTQEKDKVRALKQDSKLRATANEEWLSAVFDLQQVIHLPLSKESAIFYKQRLSNYNFSIYNIGTKDCDCYKWHEGVSKRGASEIATCVYLFLKENDKKPVKHVDLFSDGCFGQNKNSVIPTMLLYFVKNSQYIEKISLKFFEKSHGQNEGDSAHSAITTAIQKSGDLFLPSQLVPIIRLARRRHPYVVHDLRFNDFFDFKLVSKNLRILTIRKDNETQEAINWIEMSAIMVEKAEPEKIFFKTSHLQENYRSISLKRQHSELLTHSLPVLNTTPPKISSEKYNALVSLCEGNTPVIRLPEYKNFYMSLPHL